MLAADFTIFEPGGTTIRESLKNSFIIRTVVPLYVNYRSSFVDRYRYVILWTPFCSLRVYFKSPENCLHTISSEITFFRSKIVYFEEHETKAQLLWDSGETKRRLI